jgi:probable HAF family extracellular repeat protein
MLSNRSLRAQCVVIVGLGIICLGAKLAAAQSSQYIVQDLGQIDGSSSIAVAINDAGVVAGYIETPLRDTRAARAVGGTFQYVPGLEAMTSSASDVNIFGDLAGIALVSASPWTLHAIRYTDAGGVEDLGSFGGNSFGTGINRSGQVAGWSFAGSVFSTRAFVATPGQWLQDLGALSGPSASSFASGINDAGQVAGHSETTGGRWHAFRYTPGLGLLDLGTPADANSYANGINASGQVVGRVSTTSSTHAFRYTDGVGLQDLHTVSESTSEANDINDAGAVVGYLRTSGTPARAFLYTDTDGMLDLNTAIDPASGWVLNAAWGINNAGEIVGQGTYRDQTAPRAFKLIPRPADTTPPEIAGAAADPSRLWSPNLQMVAVTVSVDVSDDMDPAPVCRISHVASSEPTDPATIDINGALTVRLRAERDASGDGRVYGIEISCSDASGNTSPTRVNVLVPHDLSQPQ